jgi:hypothetical protein
MHPQSAKAKTLASKKNITPRFCGIGNTYCFCSAIERRTLAAAEVLSQP